MFWQRETSRRQILAGGLTVGAGAAAYLLVGCSPENESKPSVTQPDQVAAEKAGDYLISWLRTWPSQGPKAWHPAALSSIWALSLASREKEVVFADGASVDLFLSRAPIAEGALPKRIKVFDQITYVDLARGRIPNWKTRESYLAAAIDNDALNGNNAAMLYSIALNSWLHIGGYGGKELTEILLEKVSVNRQTNGWCTNQTSSEQADKLANVDTNAMAVLVGSAPISLLELGRQGQGWRHFVDNLDPRAEENLESTIAVGWARGLGKESLGFVLGLQTVVGSFKHSSSDPKGIPGATAEALAYFASRTHPIFGKSLGSQLSQKESWLLTTC